MSTINALKNEVKELKASINPEPQHVTIPYFFYDVDQPHGFLTGTIFHLVIDKHGTETRRYEAIGTETEIESHKAYYDKMFGKYKFMKDSSHPYSTVEKFLESNRCKCGKHGVDGKQPFTGEGKIE